MLGNSKAGNHKGNGELGIIISQSFSVPRDFCPWVSDMHQDTTLKYWHAPSFKVMHLCKIHSGLENKESRKQSYWKWGVQKTGDLILGEQSYWYTTVHNKLFFYEETIATPVIVKPKETSLPTPKKVNLRCKSI